MHERHTNPRLYFDELAKGTREFVIPYIESFAKIAERSVVLEIGAGMGGNLQPFLEEKGCTVIGIEKEDTIDTARECFKDSAHAGNLTLLKANFYDVDPNSIPRANIVVIRDVLEHIAKRELFFDRLKDFIEDGAIIFVAFPPWRMPFGGHQQGCKRFLTSRAPYYHLLPRGLFSRILKLLGEDDEAIAILDDVRKTRLSISEYKNLLKKSGFKTVKETYYLVNPSYKIKFGLTPRVLPGVLNIPFLRDFYTTAHYSIIQRC